MSFVGVYIVQRFLRKEILIRTPLEDYLLGTLPNFFAATGITALAYLYASAFYRRKITNQTKLKFGFLVSIVGLTIWEIIEMLEGPFDVYDVLMTIIGILLMVLVIKRVVRKSISEHYPSL